MCQIYGTKPIQRMVGYCRFLGAVSAVDLLEGHFETALTHPNVLPVSKFDAVQMPACLKYRRKISFLTIFEKLKLQETIGLQFSQVDLRQAPHNASKNTSLVKQENCLRTSTRRLCLHQKTKMKSLYQCLEYGASQAACYLK